MIPFLDFSSCVIPETPLLYRTSLTKCPKCKKIPSFRLRRKNKSGLHSSSHISNLFEEWAERFSPTNTSPATQNTTTGLILLIHHHYQSTTLTVFNTCTVLVSCL